MNRARDLAGLPRQTERIARLARVTGATAVLSFAVLVLSGCGTLLVAATTPLPEPSYTQGIPAEDPLPDVRTDGLSPEEVQDVTVYRDSVRAVVNVSALRTSRGIVARTATSVGSGFIIDQSARVVTNYHVIEGSSRITITLYDGTSYPAQTVGYDPEMDIAVLAFDPFGRRLNALVLADSAGLQVGQRVYALGSPFGLEGTLTRGIVSALNRPIPSQSGYIMRDLIQTDAAINSGNSGGPLLDSSGRVVGVNVAIFSPSGGSVGVGFAIPSSAARRVVRSILEDGRVERGWIEFRGVSVSPRIAAYAGLAAPEGVLVTSVDPGGNAASAGVRDGRNGPQIRYGLSQIPVSADIVTAVNGTAVRNTVEFISLLEPTQPGDTITLTVARTTGLVDLEIELVERPGSR